MAGKWIVFQLGAREHYAVARALQEGGMLEALVTDAWRPPAPMSGLAPERLRLRWVPLPQEKIHAFTKEALLREAGWRMGGLTSWDMILRRNEWFMKKAAAWLEKQTASGDDHVFSYSYAAREIFQTARRKAFQTVLGQIDPGPGEERIVRQLHERHPGLSPAWEPAPDSYWANWRKETELADWIVVNSEWSRNLLLEEEIEEEKIIVLPLVYTPPEETEEFHRSYPERFTRERPLRVLFLGQFILRKGAAEILEAAEDLEREPVEFWIAGSSELPQEKKKNVRWIGSITREETSAYYRHADVFLFPTHSDGFGLTQLEAQAWKLPIIATQNCGRVVRDGGNGLLLSHVSADSIAEAIRRCSREPDSLARWSGSASQKNDHHPGSLGKALASL